MGEVMSSRIFKDRSSGRTEFQLHISQYQTFQSSRKVLRDFTEAKLLRYLEEVQHDPSRSRVVENLIKEYRQGRVAVAWKQGEPLYVKITNIV